MQRLALAIASLGNAVAAVAAFPHQPVPESLRKRVSDAAAEVNSAAAAVDAGGGAGPAAEDLAKDAGFVAAVAKKVGKAADPSVQEGLEQLDARTRELDERLRALETPAAEATTVRDDAAASGEAQN